MRFRIFPVLLIALGSGLLLGKLGIIPSEDIRAFFHTWWPALLIALGASMLLFPREHFRHHGLRHTCGAAPATDAKTTNG